MTTPSPDRPTLWQRTTTRRFLIWLFSWRSIRFALKGLAIIVIALAGVYVGCLCVTSIWLHQAYVALEKDGRPMKVEDIIPPKVPDSENGALLIQAAVAELEAKKQGDRSLYERLCFSECVPKPSNPNMVSQEQEFKKLLAMDVVAQALRKVEDGADKPKCQFPLDYSKLSPDDLGKFMEWQFCAVRSLNRILCTRARIQAQDGNTRAAWQGIICSLRLADGLRSEPVFLSQLLRTEALARTRTAATEVSEVAPPEDEQFESLDRLLNSFEDTRPWIIACDGERLLHGEWGFSSAGHWGEYWKEPWFETPLPLVAWVWLKPIRVADHAAYLRIARLAARDSDHPFAQNKIAELTLLRERIWHVLTYCHGGELAETMRECAMIAHARVFRAGLALMRYRKAHGAFPDRLDQIEPAVRLDPFTGGPLRYRKEGAGFLVYSVGPNLRDDGGQCTGYRGEEDDVAWKFPPEEEAR